MVTLRIFIVNVFISTFKLNIFHISLQYKYKKISLMSILTYVNKKPLLPKWRKYIPRYLYAF